MMLRPCPHLDPWQGRKMRIIEGPWAARSRPRPIGPEDYVREGTHHVEVEAPAGMVEPVVGVEMAKDPGPLDATANRVVHAAVQVFVEPVIQGERGEAGPEEGPAAGGLHPPEDRSMEAHNHRRPPPLKEDEAAMLGAQDVVALIATEDAVMEADMRLVGLGDVPMEPVHQPAMECILE